MNFVTLFNYKIHFLIFVWKIIIEFLYCLFNNSNHSLIISSKWHSSSVGQSARLITEAILVRLQGGPPDKEVTAVAFDYKASAWLRLSKSIMRRDGYRCQLSKRYGKNVPAELVHHIYPVDEYPEYAMCRWNLIALSRAEHNTLHDRNTGALTAKGIALQRRTRIPWAGKFVSTLTLARACRAGALMGYSHLRSA